MQCVLDLDNGNTSSDHPVLVGVFGVVFGPLVGHGEGVGYFVGVG